MKIAVLRFVLLVTMLSASSHFVHAQTNAFTYQGSLKTGGSPVSGLYDFEFDICDAPVGGTVLATVARTGVSVTNGIFTVNLTGSPTVFSGATRYLEIRVKSSSGSLFDTLAPRQLITSSPYALKSFNATNADFAANAQNSLNATNAANATDSVNAQFATSAGFASSANSANTAATATTATTALNSNNLGGLAADQYYRFKWNVSSAAEIVASPNQGYIINQTGESTLFFPTSPTVGDVFRVAMAGTGSFFVRLLPGQTIVRGDADQNALWVPVENSRNWYSVASSDDGTKLAAVVQGGRIYTSADSGKTWVPHEADRSWSAIASSADGRSLVATVGTSTGATGQIYTSINGGDSWTPNESDRQWMSVASSADGKKLIACAYNGQIYRSTDSGQTWTPRETARTWVSVASSADGTRLVAAARQIYISTDSGATWTPTSALSNTWSRVSLSADGTTLSAVQTSGFIYVSTDLGVTFTQREVALGRQDWTSITSSADGTKLAAVVENGQIDISTDSGENWTRQESSRPWKSIASSADGSHLIAVTAGGQIYLNQRSVASGGATGRSLSSVELVYIGSGKFLLLSSKGNVALY